MPRPADRPVSPHRDGPESSCRGLEGGLGCRENAGSQSRKGDGGPAGTEATGRPGQPAGACACSRHQHATASLPTVRHGRDPEPRPWKTQRCVARAVGSVRSSQLAEHRQPPPPPLQGPAEAQSGVTQPAHGDVLCQGHRGLSLRHVAAGPLEWVGTGSREEGRHSPG